MSGWISISISFLALAVSVATAWVTLFRKGELRMTQPTVVFFGPDGVTRPGQQRHLKVFLRTLLYSTSQRGQTVESLYVNLQRGESRQNFSIWAYGDGKLSRGSGLFVPAQGVACNHHFLLPKDGTDFKFLAGEYTLRVYVKKVSSQTSRELSSIRIQISQEHAEELWDSDTGIYFDWGPDQKSYHPHIEKSSKDLIPESLLKGAD